MKRFQFRLQRLLWYQQQRQKQAEVHLQQAVMQREAASSELAIVQQQIERACQLPEQAGRLVDIAARQNSTEFLQALGRTLTAAQEKLQKTDRQLREARRGVQ